MRTANFGWKLTQMAAVCGIWSYMSLAFSAMGIMGNKLVEQWSIKAVMH